MKSKKSAKNSATTSPSSKNVLNLKEEKRDGKIFARVKPANKEILIQAQRKAGFVSLANFLDKLIEQLHEKKIL